VNADVFGAWIERGRDLGASTEIDRFLFGKLTIFVRHLAGITGELGLDEAIPQLTDAKLMALESDGAEAVQARQSMAERLRALGWAAGQLSDRLSLRHFSHITQDAQALAT